MQSELKEISNKSLLVITVCKDDPQGLKTTTESLLMQNYQEWHQIIVLASESDVALETAKNLEKSDRRISLIIQANRGIYNAMNTGLRQRESDFVWFMNSGDLFEESNSISSAIGLAERLMADLVVGGYGLISQNKTYSHPIRRYKTLSFSLNIRGACHQAMLFRRNELTILGYNEKFTIAADFHLVLELISSGSVVYQVPNIFARVTPGGVSDIELNKTLKEKQQIRNDYFGRLSVGSITGLVWMSAVKLKVISRKIMNFH